MSSEAQGMHPRATARPNRFLTDRPLRLSWDPRKGIAAWAGYLWVALRYGGPAFIMALLLVVGFTQQVRPPARSSGGWGDVYRYQCFATAFWSGEHAWLSLPKHQCDAVFNTLTYNVYTLPQSHVVPGFVLRWMVLHSHVVWQFHTLPLEYPILSLVPFSLPLLVPAAHYTQAFAAEMLLVAIGLYAFIARLAGWRPAVVFALLMGLGAYATALARFDIVPAAVTFVALVLAERRRWTAAYVLLAVATCLKIYPILFVAPVLIAQVRAAGIDPRDLWRRPRAHLRRFAGLGWFTGVCLVAIAVSVAINPIGTYRQISVLGHRPLEVESVGASLVWLGSLAHFPMQSFVWFGSDNVSSPLSKVIVYGLTVLLVAGYAYMLYALWRGRVTQAQAWLAIVLLLIVTGKIFSAQYLMWVLPFAIYLMDFSGIVPFLWMTAAALTTYSFPFLWRAEGGWHAIIALRNLVVVSLAVIAFQVQWRAKERRALPADVPPVQARRLSATSDLAAGMAGNSLASTEDSGSHRPLAAGVGGEP